jgi:hypothetical protein
MAGRVRATWESRGALGALAALLALLQLAGLAHLALLPHELCPEHGELVHAHAHAHAHRRGRAQAAGQNALSAADASLRGLEDTHCSVFLLQRARAPGSAPTVSSLLQLATGPAVAWDCGPAPRPVPILLFAPKSSPPIC